MSDSLWYFAYGSNMCPAIFIERRGMRPLATRWGWLDDHRLCFHLPVGPGERGVANLAGEPGARTCGVLYLLGTDDCERLDNSEGVHVGYYRRVPVEISVEREGWIAGFTYQSSFGSNGRKPSPRYMNLLLDGARHHGLPDDYVMYLHSFELAADERAEYASLAR